MVFHASQIEKFQVGFELEANKMDVPDSMLPRNTNARIQLNLMGYRMNALEVENSVLFSENYDVCMQHSNHPCYGQRCT